MTVEEIEIIVTAKVTEALREFKKLTPEIKSAMNQVQNEIDKVDFKVVKKEVKKVNEAMDSVDWNAEKKRLEELFDVKTIKGYSKEVLKLKGQIGTVNQSEINNKELPRMTSNDNILSQSIVDNSSLSFWDKLKEKVQTFKNQFNFEPLKQQLAQIRNVGSLINIGSTNKELEWIKYQISEIEEKLQNPTQFKMETRDIIKAEADLERLKQKKEQIEKSGSKGSFFSKLISSIKTATSKLIGMSKIMDKIKGSAGKMSSGFKSGLGSVLKYAGALFGLRSIYNVLKQSASAWLSSSNTQAQQLSANIEYMKYALGSTLAPIIQGLVNLIYQFLKGIQAVVYALTKVNIFAKATASSMNKASGSAQKASKSLSGIHSEINNVSSDNGSSGGGSASPSMDLSSMGDVSGGIFDAIANGDWSSVGSIIAEKLNSALENIPWGKIKATAQSIGTNIASFLNGFIATADWGLIGATIGEGINTALMFANGFLTEFDFSGFGLSLSLCLIGIIYSIDWETLGQNLSLGIQGLFNSITGFIQGWDWKKVTGAVIKFIKGIDFSGIADALFTALGSAAASLVNLGMVIGDYINQAIDDAKNYFQSKIEECGGNIVLGILKGIGDAIIGIGQWIKDHIFQPFIDGFKNIFGIHSPSTVMAELGTFIIQGLLDGIKSLVDKIGEIWESIKTKMKKGAEDAWAAITGVFSKIPSWFGNKFSAAWNTVKSVFSSGGQVFEGIKEGILETFKTIVNGLIDGINTVISIPFKAINKALNKIKNVTILDYQPFSFLPTITIPQIPKLATGNVAYEETLGIFAEYSNARSNPEITTPQNIMRDTFKDVLSENNEGNSESGIKQLVIQFGSKQVVLEMKNLMRQAERQNGTAYATI